MIFSDLESFLNINPALLVIILIWIGIWKGLVLWKSARLNQPVWFIVLLVVNTLGILEILYLFIFSEMKRGNKRTGKKKNGSVK